MRQRSDTWAQLAVRGRFRMESKAVINGVEYNAITAPIINRALFTDKISVGNCIAATLNFSILTNDKLPKAAEVVIMSRLTNGKKDSEWKEFGTFYINNRNRNGDIVTLACYDAMLKANQKYVDSAASGDDRIGWPKSMSICVSEIAARIGVEIDSRTVIKTTDAYQVTYPINYTMQEVLGYIGAVHGGNWIITPENKLRLVPLVSPPEETFDIVDYDYNKIYTDDGYKLVWQHCETSEIVENAAGGDLLNVPVVIGKITTGKDLTISRVTITRDQKLGYSLGDDTGAELKIENNPYASQAVCDDLYEMLSGLLYSPFVIENSCYDPCAELGDWILVGEQVRSVLCSQRLTFGVDFRVNASAPGKDETGDEYPYLTEFEKLHISDEQLREYVENTKDEIDSQILQTRESILIEVSGTYATQESVSSSIKVVSDSVTTEVKRATDAESKLSGLISVNADNITLKVSKGDVSSQISAESGEVSIKSNRLTVDSENFKLYGTGFVEIKGGLENEYTFSDGSSWNAKIGLGCVFLGHDGADYAELNAFDDALNIESRGKGISFWTSNGQCIAISEGLDMGFPERVQIYKATRFHDQTHLNSTLHWHFDGTEYGHIGCLDGGGLSVSNSFNVEGDFSCAGTKNRIVETENYGSLTLNAVESTAAFFSDMGSATADDSGVAEVYFDPRFIEVIDSVHDFIVSITPTNSNGVKYVKKGNNCFTAYGEPNSTFDWIVYARQKNYAQTYLERFSKQTIETNAEDNSVTIGDNIPASLSESYMNEFTDNYDKLADVYLNSYESEVTE